MSCAVGVPSRRRASKLRCIQSGSPRRHLQTHLVCSRTHGWAQVTHLGVESPVWASLSATIAETVPGNSQRCLVYARLLPPPALVLAPFFGDSGQDAQPVGRGILSAFVHSFQVVTRLTVVKGHAGRTVTESLGTRRSIERRISWSTSRKWKRRRHVSFPGSDVIVQRTLRTYLTTF